MKKLILILCVAVAATISIGYISPLSAMTIDNKDYSSILISEEGQVLSEVDSHNRRPIASMVKIMTLLNIYEAIESKKIAYSDTVTISAYAASMGGSQAFIAAAQTYNVGELLKTIIVASANDSCVALAEHLCGSVENFVKLMNDKVTQLNLKDTVYVNCTGLPAIGQFSSAYDSAMIFSNLIKHKDYFNNTRIWTEEFKHPDGRTTLLTNTNKLIRQYNGCDAGKTGFTNEAMHCITATAVKNNTRVVACVVGANDSATRFSTATSLFNYAFANYENITALSSDKQLENINIKSGVKETLNIKASKNLNVFGKKGEIKGELTFEVDGKLKAPISKGDKVGNAYFIDQGKVISQVDLVANEDINEMTYWDSIKKIIANW